MNTQYQQFPDKYFGKNTEFKLESPETFKKNQSKFRQNLIKFIEKLPRNAKVLDAGCGNCKVTKNILILRPDIKVYAMDISDVSNFVPAGVEFKIGSIEDLDSIYENNYFDAVISLHVIEHLLFPMKMITSIRNVLKKGGLMFLETPNWVRIFMPFSQHFFWNDYTHVRPFSKFSMNKLLTEYNFDHIKMITTNTMSLVNNNESIGCCASKVVNNSAIKNNNKSIFRKSVDLLKKILLRLIHPLFKDVLIVEAEKNHA